jgi:hypothetical protein
LAAVHNSETADLISHYGGMNFIRDVTDAAPYLTGLQIKAVRKSASPLKPLLADPRWRDIQNTSNVFV